MTRTRTHVRTRAQNLKDGREEEKLRAASRFPGYARQRERERERWLKGEGSTGYRGTGKKERDGGRGRKTSTRSPHPAGDKDKERSQRARSNTLSQRAGGQQGTRRAEEREIKRERARERAREEEKEEEDLDEEAEAREHEELGRKEESPGSLLSSTVEGCPPPSVWGVEMEVKAEGRERERQIVRP